MPPAKVADGQFLLFLNPDTKAFPNTVTKLLAFTLDHPDAGIWGGQIVDSEGGLDLSSYRRFPNLWDMFCLASGLARSFPRSGVFNREVYANWSRDTPRQVDVVTGAMMLVSRSLWEQLDGFDPIYFLYSEEVDLCYRAHKLGARPMATPLARLYHEGGGAQPNRGKRLIFLLQGKATFMHRHWGPVRRRAGKLLLLLWPLSRKCTLSITARLCPDNLVRYKAAEWQKVWQARERWLSGYPEPGVEPLQHSIA